MTNKSDGRQAMSAGVWTVLTFVRLFIPQFWVPASAGMTKMAWSECRGVQPVRSALVWSGLMFVRSSFGGSGVPASAGMTE